MVSCKSLLSVSIGVHPWLNCVSSLVQFMHLHFLFANRNTQLS